MCAVSLPKCEQANRPDENLNNSMVNKEKKTMHFTGSDDSHSNAMISHLLQLNNLSSWDNSIALLASNQDG